MSGASARRRFTGGPALTVAAALLLAGCASSSDAGAVDVPRPGATAAGSPEPATVPDACTIASPEEVATAAKLPAVVVSVRAVQTAAPVEDLCGFGAPPSIGTYAVALALRTGVSAKSFAAERAGIARVPQFSKATLPADGKPRPVAALGDEAWSRVTYAFSSRTARPTGVEVQARVGGVGLRVVIPQAPGAVSDPDPALELARAAVQRVPASLTVPREGLEGRCAELDQAAIERAMGAPVRATRSVLHLDGDAQCWYDGGGAFLEVVVRSSPEAIAAAPTPAPGSRTVQVSEDATATYVTSPHQDGVLRTKTAVVSLRGLTAQEAKGNLPQRPVRRPSAPDTALLAALVDAVG